MRTIGEVKEFLDRLARKEESPVIAETVRLPPSQMTEADCQLIDRELSIRLPESYRRLLLAYDWSNLRLGNLRLFGGARAIIENNRPSRNPFHKSYRANHLLEVGCYEADSVCVRLRSRNKSEGGEIVYIDHSKYPEVKAEFVSGDLERLVVCAAIDLRFKKEARYYEWRGTRPQGEEESLYSRIMDAILRVEPRATESSFWYKFIRGF
jgi:hypothetical protein